MPFDNDDFQPTDDSHAQAVDAWLSRLDQTSNEPTGMASDRFATQDLHRNTFGDGGKVKHGRIQMGMPYADWYRVALDDADGIFPCCSITPGTTSNLIGPRDTSVLPPDSRVLVWIHQTNLYGFIIGSIPEIVEDGNYIFPDWISQGSGVGIKRDAYYYDYVNLLGDEGGVIDFSNSRPLDQLCFDWGKMTETGLGIHIDPFMTFLRADDATGMWAFYHDQLMRVRGHNLEMFSAMREDMQRDDEGEMIRLVGEAIYPWEAMAAFTHGEDVSKENTPEDTLYELAEGSYEPSDPQNQPFYRWREYGGYLGQGRIRLMTLPPSSKVGLPYINKYSDTEPRLGVFKEQIALDGSYSIESAKQIIIAKRTLIPVPKRIKPVDDYSTECDSKDNKNYKHSGKFGDGEDVEEHKVGDIKVVGANKQLLVAANIMDLHAYAFNWKNMHAFHYHKGDYNLPEEEDLASSPTKVQMIPPFDDLKTKPWLPRPSAEIHNVDDRYGNVDYFEVCQHITMTDDGALVIQGGQGEEIRMVGGSIQISAPGNVFLQPGKGLIALAGDDAIIRANRSIDITATRNDVRIKAERNMQLLASNGSDGGAGGGQGVLLLENRAANKNHDYPEEGGEKIAGSGVIIKTPKSQFAALSAEIYLRTGSPKGGIDKGDITLDAAKGATGGNVRMVGANMYRFIANEAVDGFGVPNVATVNRFGRGGSLFCNNVTVNGSLIATKNGMFGGGVSVKGSVGKAKPNSLDAIMAKISFQCAGALQAHRAEWNSLEQDLYFKDKIGDATTMKKISYGCRNTEQLSTDKDFVMPQTWWQILNEVAGAGEAWVENDIKYQGGIQIWNSTYVGNKDQPWPGKKNWEGDTFLRLTQKEFTMYDLEEGYAKDRDVNDSPYEDPKYTDFKPGTPKEHYKVITGD
jgi:hypothetical protein